jgi:hypothetical protein
LILYFDIILWYYTLILYFDNLWYTLHLFCWINPLKVIKSQLNGRYFWSARFQLVMIFSWHPHNLRSIPATKDVLLKDVGGPRASLAESWTSLNWVAFSTVVLEI